MMNDSGLIEPESSYVSTRACVPAGQTPPISGASPAVISPLLKLTNVARAVIGVNPRFQKQYAAVPSSVTIAAVMFFDFVASIDASTFTFANASAVPAAPVAPAGACRAGGACCARGSLCSTRASRRQGNCGITRPAERHEQRGKRDDGCRRLPATEVNPPSA